MGQMDVPGRSQPLADSFDERRAGDPRRPYPDRGASRSPAELLDELRLRLSQLPENHPSAPSEKADGRPRGWPERPDRPDRPDRPEQADLPEKAAQPEKTEQPDSGKSGPDASEPEPGGAADRPANPAKAGGEADGSAGGLLDWLRDLDVAGKLPDLADWGAAELDLSWPGHPATYRPWFMTGEPATPWFAADDDL
jgi:hypothetical protein